MMSSPGVGGRAPFRRGAAMDRRRRRRGPGEQVRGGTPGAAGVAAARRDPAALSQVRPGSSRRAGSPRRWARLLSGGRAGSPALPRSGTGQRSGRAPPHHSPPGRGAGARRGWAEGLTGCGALFAQRRAPARLTPPHPAPPSIGARSEPRAGLAVAGAGGGRGRGGGCPRAVSGRWIPAALGAAPAAPRGWAPAAAESEPPEIPVPLIPRWLRTGIPAGRSLPSAPLPVPGRHTPLPPVPRRQELPGSASAGHGTGSQPRSGARGAAVGGQRALAGRWARPTPALV